MALNPFFSSRVRTEQNLVEDLMIEAIKMYGVNIKYLPRNILSKDELLGEDILSSFESAFTVEVYVESVDGFEGDGTLFSKFGLEIRDQCTLVVAKRRWAKEVGVWKEGENPLRPSEGDLIYLPMSKCMFEVKFVEHESPFYQLQNVAVYKLQCELFEYSNEKIQVGDEAIDSVQNENAFTIALEVEYTLGNTFLQGDSVIQNTSSGKSLSGIVMKTEKAGVKNMVYVGYIASATEKFDDFKEATLLSKADNTVVANVKKVYTLSDTENFTALNDPTEQNHLLQQKATEIIDFTEENPFGDLT